MFCANCGQQIPDNIKFCPFCGAPVVTAQPSQPSQPVTYQQPQAPTYTQPMPYVQTMTPQSVYQQQNFQQQTPYTNPAGYPSVTPAVNPSAMKRYIFPRGTSLWLSLACLVFLVFMLLSDYHDKEGMSIILGTGVVLCAIPTLIGIGRMNKKLKMLTESGALNACAADYAKARKSIRNRIAFGDQWLFGCGTGNMVRYEDIVQIYRHKTTVNWIFKVYDVLEIRLANNKIFTICRVPLFHKKEELQDVYRVVNSKNPYAKLGI